MSYEKIVHQDNRADWLVERRNSIGASDCPSILGLTSWASPTSVQADKWGKLDEPERAEYLEWGNLMEDDILEMFRRRTGIEVEPFGWMIRDQAVPWLHATPDGLGDDGRFVQCKNVSAFGDLDYWRNGECPPKVFAQQQHEFIVSGHTVSWVAANLLGSELVVIEVCRDENFIERWLKIAGAFWQATLAGEPLVSDGDPATHAALAKIYPGNKGSALREVGADWVEKVSEQTIRAAEIKRLTALSEQFKAEAKQVAGDDGGLLLPDGRRVVVQRVEMKESVRKAHTQTRVSIK